MSRNIIIAFSGWAKSGKDSAADVIEDILSNDFYYTNNISSCTRLSFASPIKEVIQIVFGIKENEIENKDVPIVKLKKIFKKNDVTYRDLNILLGENFKSLINPNIWAFALENKIKNIFKNKEQKNGDNVIIIPDVRFFKEIKMIQNFEKHGTEVYYFGVYRESKLPEWVKLGLWSDTDWERSILEEDFNIDKSEYQWCASYKKLSDLIVNNGTLSDLKNEVKNKIIDKIWKNKI